MNIDHLCIVVKDLEKSKIFYRKIFKAEVLLEKEVGGKWFDQVTGFKNARAVYCVIQLPFSDLKLELLHFISPKSKPEMATLNTCGFRHIALSVNNAEVVFKYLEDLKIRTFSGPTDNESGKVMFYFKGPDNEVIEIAEYKEQATVMKKSDSNGVKIYSDGGSRGNPGPSGAGYIIFDRKNKEIARGKKFLGDATNNIAEWNALILALHKAQELGATEAECLLDSELVVKQASGQYKVKNPGLQQIFIKFHNIRSKFKKLTFKHIPREKNKLADRLANEAMDGLA